MYLKDVKKSVLYVTHNIYIIIIHQMYSSCESFIKKIRTFTVNILERVVSIKLSTFLTVFFVTSVISNAILFRLFQATEISFLYLNRNQFQLEPNPSYQIFKVLSRARSQTLYLIILCISR